MPAEQFCKAARQLRLGKVVLEYSPALLAVFFIFQALLLLLLAQHLPQMRW
jgi:hypothetical protein